MMHIYNSGRLTTSATFRSILAAFTLCAACNSAARSVSDSSSSALSANAASADSSLPLVADTLRPTVITDTVPGDSDDPAIWVNPQDSSRSIVLGTDKADANGAVYAFDLSGHIDRLHSAHPLMRMNNVDREYGLARAGGFTDIAVSTERNRQMLRVHSLPDMRPIDGGGIVVFDNDKNRAPMGIALYKRPRDGAIFAFVAGKAGPADGSYIWQYRLTANASGIVTGTKVRAFGAYSGK